MKKRYEALLALGASGREDSVKDIIERLEKTFVAEGAAIEQVQRFERRELAYKLKHLSSAYFVNFVFEAESGILSRLRAKLKLDEDVVMQNYLRLPARKKTAEAAA